MASRSRRQRYYFEDRSSGSGGNGGGRQRSAVLGWKSPAGTHLSAPRRNHNVARQRPGGRFPSITAPTPAPAAAVKKDPIPLTLVSSRSCVKRRPPTCSARAVRPSQINEAHNIAVHHSNRLSAVCFSHNVSSVRHPTATSYCHCYYWHLCSLLFILDLFSTLAVNSNLCETVKLVS